MKSVVDPCYGREEVQPLLFEGGHVACYDRGAPRLFSELPLLEELHTSPKNGFWEGNKKVMPDEQSHDPSVFGNIFSTQQ